MKTVWYFSIPLLIAALVTSCGNLTELEKPEKVSVKATDASYSVSLGSGTVTVSDHFNASTLKDNITKDSSESKLSSISVYDYWPNTEQNVQQFLFHYPVATIPLDFGEYLDNLELLSSLSKGISQEFAVPAPAALEISESLALPDINSIVVSSFALDDVNNITVPELTGQTLNVTDGSFSTIPITITAPEFATMDFSGGSLVITFERLDTESMDASFACTLAATLKTQSGAVITSTADSVSLAIASNAKATIELPLAGKSLVPALQLSLAGTYGGGSTGSIHQYAIKAKLSSDTQLSRITGLTLTTEDLGSDGVVTLPDQTIDLSSAGEYLISGTISEGEMTISGLLPDGWTGISCTPNIQVTGGLSKQTASGTQSGLSNDDFTTVTATDGKSYLLNKRVDLQGMVINPQENATLSGTLTIGLNNATIDLTSATTEVDLCGAVALSKLGQSTIDIDKLVDSSKLSQTVSQSLGTTGSYVQSVTFNELGVTGTISCDLPTSGMSVKPTITSNLFGITSAEPLTCDAVTLTAGTPAQIALSTENLSSWNASIQPATTPDADFAIQIAFTGTDTANPSYITLSSLEFGKTYTFAADLELIYDWENIILNTSATSDLTFNDKIETGLDLQSMLEEYLEGEQKDLLDNVQFGGEINGTTFDVTAYLNVSRPPYEGTDDPLAQFPSFSADIAAITYTSEEGQETPVANTPIALYNGDISLINAKGDYDSLVFEDKDKQEAYINKDIFASEDSYSAKLTGFAAILNSRPSGLDISYDIAIASSGTNTIELTKQQVETLTQKDADGNSKYASSIEMAVDVVIPLVLTITDSDNDGIGILVDNVLELAGKTFEEDEDVLKRDEPDSVISERFKKYGKVVKQISISYNLANNTGLGLSAEMVLTKEKSTDASGNEVWTDGLTKAITADSEDHRLYLDNSEIEQILDTYPFQPIIRGKIMPGTIKVPRNAQFTAKATVTLTFDGEVVVYGDDEEE